MDPFTIGLIVAGIGGVAGLIGGWQDANEAEAEARAQARAEEELRKARIKAQQEQAEREIALANDQFDIETQNAIEQASDMELQARLTDQKTTQQESLIGQAYNQTMQQLGMNSEQLAAQEQSARLSFAQNQGAAAAAMGASGTRSGSSAERVLSQNQTAFQQDIDRANAQNQQGQEIALAQAYAGLQDNLFNVGIARINANETFSDAGQLRSDYAEGGRAYDLFQTQIANRRADLESSIDLQNLAGDFAQDAYDRQIERSQFGFLDAFTTILGGASSGMQLGFQAANYYNDWGANNQIKQTPLNTYSPTRGYIGNQLNFGIGNNLYSSAYGF